MKAKGFTLIELLAVIIILGVLLTITITAVDVLVKNSKSSLSENQKERVEEAAEMFYINEGMNINSTCVNVQFLTQNGYIEGKDVIDPKTKESLGGSVKIEKDLNQYIYEYQEDTCPSLSFKDDSWETIAANVRAGFGEMYEVGDTKEVTLSGTEFEGKTFTLRVANTSTPAECKNANFSQTACGFVVEFEDIITTRGMNSNSNVGGYPASAMYTYLKDNIFKALPEELQKVIIDTKVISGHGSTAGENNFESTDKLYLLAPHEIWENGTSNTVDGDLAWDKTRQLDYYAKKEVTTDSGKYTPVIKNYNNIATTWWLRSAHSSNNFTFFYVYSSGGWYYYPANFAHGVSPAFRLG